MSKCFSLRLIEDARKLASAMLATEGASSEAKALSADVLKRIVESEADLDAYSKEVELARAGTDDDLEIDETPMLSVADEGVWVQAWIYIRKES